jgi:hypothetical protein
VSILIEPDTIFLLKSWSALIELEGQLILHGLIGFNQLLKISVIAFLLVLLCVDYFPLMTITSRSVLSMSIERAKNLLVPSKG